MKTFMFQCELWLPRPIDEVFEFFSNANNLQAITPWWLSFKVLTPGPIKIRAGTHIDYKLRIRGIPVRWQTEITEWTPPYRFVDVQKRGPYRRWVHEHTFTEQNGGTQCRDFVRYAVRGGALINRLFVRRDVEKIFNHRQKKMRELLAVAETAK
jgi:ligand-binding SRPBCC domain-containing protein